MQLHASLYVCLYLVQLRSCNILALVVYEQQLVNCVLFATALTLWLLCCSANVPLCHCVTYALPALTTTQHLKLLLVRFLLTLFHTFTHMQHTVVCPFTVTVRSVAATAAGCCTHLRVSKMKQKCAVTVLRTFPCGFNILLQHYWKLS